jgi:very-short-patch-repair endonuclease
MSGNAVYCGYSCRIKNAGNKKCEGKELVKCAICGLERRSLGGHIRRTHKISLTEYMEKYDKIMDDVIPKSVRDKIGEKVRGENNGAYGHGGKYSPYSKNFVKYETLSEEEKSEKIEKLNKQHGQTHIKNQKSSNQIGYWIRLGYTEDEAIQKVSDRQKTFTKEKCIEKYGEEEGLKRWKERQINWQNTLKSKPIEEQERINRSKFKNNGYSEISQKLFLEIYEIIKNDYNEIFFAKHGNNNMFNNGEYSLHDSAGFIFLDFLVKDTKKCIEFDGDYWHGEARGNKTREETRNMRIINQGYNLLHVQERDYKENPQKIIQECLNFIHG